MVLLSESESEDTVLGFVIHDLMIVGGGVGFALNCRRGCQVRIEL